MKIQKKVTLSERELKDAVITYLNENGADIRGEVNIRFRNGATDIDALFTDIDVRWND